MSNILKIILCKLGIHKKKIIRTYLSYHYVRLIVCERCNKTFGGEQE